MKHHRWMATNGRLDQETVWFVEKNRISAKKWKTTFFFRNNFGLANNDRGSTQQKMAEMQTQDRESHSKMMGFWLKHGVPTHADLGLAFNPSNQWWETTSGHNQLPDMVKTLQRSQIVLKKNPVAGRLVCNLNLPLEGDSKEHEHYDRQGPGTLTLLEVIAPSIRWMSQD